MQTLPEEGKAIYHSCTNKENNCAQCLTCCCLLKVSCVGDRPCWTLFVSHPSDPSLLILVSEEWTDSCLKKKRIQIFKILVIKDLLGCDAIQSSRNSLSSWFKSTPSKKQAKKLATDYRITSWDTTLHSHPGDTKKKKISGLRLPANYTDWTTTTFRRN
jgi:hypothetical protein